MKKITIITAFLFLVTVNVFAGSDPVKTNGDTSVDENTTTEQFDVLNSKEFHQIFRRIKRVDNLLKPKKRLRKKKYTIA